MLQRLRSALQLAIFALFLPGLARAQTKPDPSARAEFLQQLKVNGPDCSSVDGLVTTGPEIVPPGEKFVSPDRRFSVQLGLTRYQWDFVITDRESGAVSHWPSDYSPIFSVGWTSDSRSIVAVAHTAHCSSVELLHWDGHQWKYFDIDDPRAEDNSHVVSWKFEKGALWVTTINEVEKRTSSSGFYRCVFKVDPATGKTSHAGTTPLTLEQYCQLRAPQN